MVYFLEEEPDDQDPIYGEEPAGDEKELYPDMGHLLVVRCSCLTPNAATQFPQRNKLFQSRYTINRKFGSFVIDSGSCENIIAADAVSKFQLKDEPHRPLTKSHGSNKIMTSS